MAPSPLGSNSDNEIDTILMAADPPGQASKMAGLLRKRLNFVQKD